MTEQSKVVIETTLKADNTLTQAQKTAVLNAMQSALSGNQQQAKEDSRVIKWKDVAARLGIGATRARQLAKSGKLTPVTLTGKYSYGVTLESLNRLIENGMRAGAAYSYAIA